MFIESLAKRYTTTPGVILAEDASLMEHVAILERGKAPHDEHY